MNTTPKSKPRLNSADSFLPDQSLAIFRRMCTTRYFELGVIDAVRKRNKEIVCPGLPLLRGRKPWPPRFRWRSAMA